MIAKGSRRRKDDSDGDRDASKGAPRTLTRAELKEFRRLLIEKQHDILGDMSGMEVEAKQKAPASPDVLDDDNYRQEVTMGLLRNERELLQEIAEALDRIEKGTYGVCLATGRPISKSRLRARPWAKYCIEHAREMEKHPVVAPSPHAESTGESHDEPSYADEEDAGADSDDAADLPAASTDLPDDDRSS